MAKKKVKVEENTISDKRCRIVTISDLHCGHFLGLTPPEFQYNINSTKDSKFKNIAKIQNEMYGIFMDLLKPLQPIDICIVNGDAIDGDGNKSGGTELITTDRNDQIEMAKNIIETIGAKKNIFIAGTPYHNGAVEDWEKVLAEKCDSEFYEHEFLEKEGVVFDYRHFISRSSSPYGQYTPLAKEKIWNILMVASEEAPEADVVVRSHIHYHAECSTPDWRVLTTPALQARGSKFGNRKCSGSVHFGFVHFDVYNKSYMWKPHVVKIKSNKKKIIKI